MVQLHLLAAELVEIHIVVLHYLQCPVDLAEELVMLPLPERVVVQETHLL